MDDAPAGQHEHGAAQQRVQRDDAPREDRADEDALNNTSFHTPNLFGLWVAPDFNDTAHYTAYLMQGGIGLPDREYYLSDAEAMKEIRQKYRAHIVTVMKLAGFDDVEARAERSTLTGNDAGR